MLLRDERQILVLAAVSLLPAEIFVTKITLVLLISRRQLNGRQRGTQEMAAVRKWLLTMNCQLLGCEPNI